MNEERWLTAKEAQEMGFVKTINDPFDKAAFAGVRSEIQASGKWPVALINKEEKNHDADTAGSKGEENGESGIPDKPAGETETPEHSADYKAGIADGDARTAARVAGESKEQIDKLDKALTMAKADIEKRDTLISKKQSEFDQAQGRIKTLQKSLDEAAEKTSKLLAGGMTFQPEVKTWEEAVTTCNGNYAEAAKRFPELKKEYNANHKQK